MTAELPQPQPTDAVIVGGARTPFTRLLSQQAVSYTHLTLPTIYSV